MGKVSDCTLSGDELNTIGVRRHVVRYIENMVTKRAIRERERETKRDREKGKREREREREIQTDGKTKTQTYKETKTGRHLKLANENMFIVELRSYKK